MSGGIVLVDDDAGLRTELRTLLEDGGYHVVADLPDGAQAIAAARAAAADLVISDLRMPGLSGLDVAAALQGEVPVVILSAFDDESLQAQARRHGATFLVKGCRSRTIFAAVDAATASPDGAR